MAEREQILRLKTIDKRFPGVHALREVDFSLLAGEVRGLVGENGAGKSTLMNILGGVLQQDSGSIEIDGKECFLTEPKKAEEQGISFIHQELSLFPNLDVATNIFIHSLPRRGVFLDRKSLYENSRPILNRVGLETVNPRMRIKSLRMGQRQLVEIGQSLVFKPKILILDEPTSSLTNNEIEKLFEIIQSLKAQNVAIIFISHRLDEIFTICDSITVMRDGQNVKTASIEELSKDEVVHLMIGREMNELYSHKSHERGKRLLSVKKFSHSENFQDISFDLHAGEIVGLYGLMGAGRTELVRSIFGLDPHDAGSISIEEQAVEIRSPSEAIENGMALITENRREEGLDINHSVQSNLVLANLKKIRGFLSLVDSSKEQSIAKSSIESLRIKTSSPKKIVRFLSGGNQQKVVIAKWLNTNPKIIMLDEPTRGIDVGAKKEVFNILDDLLEEDVGIFLISSELSEMTGVCDRVLVIRAGRIVAELSGESMSEENLLAYAMGVKK